MFDEDDTWFPVNEQSEKAALFFVSEFKLISDAKNSQKLSYGWSVLNHFVCLERNLNRTQESGSSTFILQALAVKRFLGKIRIRPYGGVNATCTHFAITSILP